MKNPGDHLEKRAFAGTVFANNAECFALVNLKGDIADGPEIAVEGDTVEAGKFLEARARRGVNGITFGDVPKLYDWGRHLLESTGGEKACQFWWCLKSALTSRFLAVAVRKPCLVGCSRLEEQKSPVVYGSVKKPKGTDSLTVAAR